MKAMKKFGIILLVLALVCSVLTGCGGSKEKDPVAGTWVIDSVEYEGYEMNPADLGVSEFTIEIDGNGKGSMSITNQDGNAKGRVTYELRDSDDPDVKILDMVVDGESTTAYYCEPIMLLEWDGVDFYFTRA